jgi:hypothetical protein
LPILSPIFNISKIQANFDKRFDTGSQSLAPIKFEVITRCLLRRT